MKKLLFVNHTKHAEILVDVAKIIATVKPKQMKLSMKRLHKSMDDHETCNTFFFLYK